MKSKLVFLGGTETVTGSKYLLESNAGTQVLIDCGLFQGYKWLRERNWQPLPVDLASLDAVVLTHAHLDHSGYLPVLYKRGYRGPVYCHPATRELCGILLADSGHLQEEDARYYAKHKLSKHAQPEPLYDRETAQACMELFRPVEFEQPFEVGGIQFRLQPAGHILGAASVISECDGTRIGFSGDVGRPDDIFMPPPKPLPELDLLLLESTYGDRRHEAASPFEQLAQVVRDTAKRGGVLLMPSFAVGRAQMLQYMLSEMMFRGDIPKLPIYLDSPMAIDVSEIYERYADLHRLQPEQYRRISELVTCTRSVDESKELAGINYPHIIIAGSGMATGGRILHHLKRYVSDPRHTVLFPGYQAGGTRGDKMRGGAPSVKIHGEWLPVRARIETLQGLSGHADYTQIGQWLADSKLGKHTAIKLVHGDPVALEAQRDYLRQHYGYAAEVACYRQVLHLGEP